jgi:hypothetical protein
LYEALVERIAEDLLPLQTTSRAICDLDVLACFAERANALSLSRPTFSEQAQLDISNGRHPVVEQVSDKPFIANNTLLNEDRRMLLITGTQYGRQIDVHAAKRAYCSYWHTAELLYRLIAYPCRSLTAFSLALDRQTIWQAAYPRSWLK